jgi:hypothetical protein
MTESSELSPDVMQAIEAGRKIDAIKLLRAERGIDLKEAKDVIDQAVATYREANPEYEERSSSGGLSSIIGFVVLAAILYYVFTKFF